MASGKGHPWYDGGKKTQEQVERDEQQFLLSRSVLGKVTYSIFKPVYDSQPEENEWER